MINKLYLYESTVFDPYHNLATEQYLMDNVESGSCILYLWQNQNTVVIGKNQNAWAECRVSLLEQEGGRLARRLSGGGAVYHDLGNLNFTFITTEENYDVDRQLSVIQAACAQLGILVEKSGRNDLLVDGFKFSGNAFYHRKGRAYHHGTLLIHSDMDKLQRYLSPPTAKLEAKGISSVRSRVINLSQLAPGLTVETMSQNMQAAFAHVYGIEPTRITLGENARASIAELQKKNESWEHLFGTPLPFTFQCQQHFLWGNVQLNVQSNGGMIQSAKVYTDAMDWQLPQKIEAALTGCKFTAANMQDAIHSAIDNAAICNDLCNMIQNQNI